MPRARARDDEDHEDHEAHERTERVQPVSRLHPVPFGDAAVRYALPKVASLPVIFRALRNVPGVRDVVFGEEHVVVTFAPSCKPPGLDETLRLALTASMTAMTDADASSRDGRAADREPARRVHRITVRYDGPDLHDVAAACGVTADDVVALHSGRAYVVERLGFLPGFAYLGDVDPRIVVARRPTPRPRVAALAVAIAGHRTAIYPFASPGGWNLLGRAIGFTPFDRREGAVFALGDEVNFQVEAAPEASRGER